MSLASFLQEAFANAVPEGWQCAVERPLLPARVEKELGFAPRVDVVLANQRLGKRIWVEFEVSRADPAANHLKFAVGHLFAAGLTGDTFLSMVSNHVARGRANLGASSILLMRYLGLHAFQTPLLPLVAAHGIKELNHLPVAELQQRGIDVVAEMSRALAITTPVANDGGDEVYYAGNEFEVALNVRQWNSEIHEPGAAERWGKRTVKYFVHDRVSRCFAPSKFSAFLTLPQRADGSRAGGLPGASRMSIARYCALEQSASRFDGGNAQRHLRQRLGYRAGTPAGCGCAELFASWLSAHARFIRQHPDGPVILEARR